MKYIHIFNNLKLYDELRLKKLNCTHYDSSNGIDFLIRTILDLIESIEIGLNKHVFIFNKPSPKYSEFYDKKSNNFITIKHDDLHLNEFFKTYVNLFVSTDGYYESNVLDMKMDFLKSFLDDKKINYIITDDIPNTMDFLKHINDNF